MQIYNQTQFLTETQSPNFKIQPNTIIQGDCLNVMKYLPDNSIDMILTDPPYGTTACRWDSIIPLEPMWEQLKRVIKPNGAIVMTAAQPFTSILVSSNIKMFKYDWVWQKSRPTGVLNAKKQPLRDKEDILVFYNKQPTYNPQGLEYKGCYVGTGATKANQQGNATGKITQTDDGKYFQDNGNYPRQVQFFKSDGKTVHPTQKPVALMEYLIKTYTNENETVLDFTAGSFTTGVACQNTNRQFIGIELDEAYFEIGKKRLGLE